MKCSHLLLLAAVVFVPRLTRANVIVSLQESGSDVVASYSGSIDLTGGTYQSASSNSFVEMSPSGDLFRSFGGTSTFYDFSSWTGPSSFGGGGTTSGSSMTGSDFGFMPNGDDPTHFLVWVPSASLRLRDSVCWDRDLCRKDVEQLGRHVRVGRGQQHDHADDRRRPRTLHLGHGPRRSGLRRLLDVPPT